MLEILYRIYEVADEETAKMNMEQDANIYLYSSESRARNTELVMDCMISESRDDFKESIKRNRLDRYNTYRRKNRRNM